MPCKCSLAPVVESYSKGKLCPLRCRDAFLKLAMLTVWPYAIPSDVFIMQVLFRMLAKGVVCCVAVTSASFTVPMLFRMLVKGVVCCDAVTGAFFIVQILAMGFFAGGQRGLNLVIGAVSFNAYSYKGLVRNELQAGNTWGCPQEGYLPGAYTPVRLLSFPGNCTGC